MTISKQIADHYRNHSQIQFRLAQQLLSTHDFNADRTILDIGCGDGKVTNAIAEKSKDAEVFGVDISPEMIALATQTYPHLSFQIADAATLDLSLSFDTITCLCCLYWVKKPALAIANMVNHLNSNGTLLILSFPKESRFWNILAEALQDTRFSSFKSNTAMNHILTSEGHKKALLQTELRIDRFQIDEKVANYENEQEFMNYVKGWLPCYVKLPILLQESFLEHVSKIAARDFQLEGQKKLAIPYTMLSIKATRDQCHSLDAIKGYTKTPD